MAVVVVPERIMCAIVRPKTKDSLFACQNEFPHLTLLVGKWQPKNSNDVLTALFGKGGKLELELKQIYEGSEGYQRKVNKVAVCNEIVDAYVLKLRPYIDMRG